MYPVPGTEKAARYLLLLAQLLRHQLLDGDGLAQQEGVGGDGEGGARGRGQHQTFTIHMNS